MKYINRLNEGIDSETEAWINIPKDDVESVKRLLTMHFKLTHPSLEQNFLFDLGLEALCKDIITTIRR